MKAALHEGGATTLNLYAADFGGGLLGWAYFPKDHNHGRDFIDGVVILLDESMPGGVGDDGKPWRYGLGDTLTHEVGLLMMVERMSDAWLAFRVGAGADRRVSCRSVPPVARSCTVAGRRRGGSTLGHSSSGGMPRRNHEECAGSM